MNRSNTRGLFAFGVGALVVALTGCQDSEQVSQVVGITPSVVAGQPGLDNGSGSRTHGGSHEVVVTQENEVQFTKTTFEGGGNVDPIHPEAGNEIPGSGMRFPGWLTIIDGDAGGSGNFANEPSPKTTAFWLCNEAFPCDGDFPTNSREVLFNDPVAAVSFSYASVPQVTLEAFDADGNLVANAIGASNFNLGPGGDPNGSFNQWDPLGVDAGENVITRVRITGNENQTGIDDFTTSEISRARAVVAEGGGTVTINDADGNTTAGIQIPAGALDEAVEFTITLIDFSDPACTSDNVLLLEQIGQCLSIRFNPPNVMFNELVIVGICLDESFLGDQLLHVYRVLDTQIQRLQNVPAPFLACDPEFMGSAPRGNGFWEYARGILRRATGWFQPRPLYAKLAVADRGFGGETDCCSDFIWGFAGMDIKPGSDPNTINCLNADEVITVAALTTPSFDATTLDHTRVSFEGGLEIHVDKKTFEPRLHFEDVDLDGDTDMVFHFRQGDTDLTCQSTSGQLTGQTVQTQDSEPIFTVIGADLVRMIQD